MPSHPIPILLLPASSSLCPHSDPPQIHVAQYPLDLGRKDGGGRPASSAGVLPVTVNADGTVDYTALVKQGRLLGLSE